MATPLNLEPRHFPSRIADLGFTSRLPVDWIAHQLPPDGSETIEQYHFLMDFRDESLVLRARITATPDKASFACNLGELVLNSFRFAVERPQATA